MLGAQVAPYQADLSPRPPVNGLASSSSSVDLAQAPVAARGAPVIRGHGIRAVVRLGLGVGVLVLILRHLDLTRLSVRWDARLLGALTLAVTLLLLAQALSAGRWKVILGSAGPGVFSLWRLYLISSFFSLFLPTSVGGDAVRVMLAGRATGRMTEAATSVLLDRLLGVVALGAFLALGLLLAPAVLTNVGATIGWQLPTGGWRSVGWVGVGVGVVVGSAALLAATVAASRLGVVRRAWLEGWAEIVRFGRSGRALSLGVGLALFVQAIYIHAWIVLAHGLGFDLPWRTFLVSVPLVSLGAMLPVTLCGLGVREGTWLILLRPYHLAPAAVVAYSLLYFLCVVVVGSVGGACFIASDVATPRGSR